MLGRLKRITRQWLRDHLVCKGKTYPAQLTYKMTTDMGCQRIIDGINRSETKKGGRTFAVLDLYNSANSTMRVSFNTSETDRYEMAPRPWYSDWTIFDSDWEAKFFRVAKTILQKAIGEKVGRWLNWKQDEFY